MFSFLFFSVNGRWSNWAAWSRCSKTCGNGTKNRLRTCTNPPPKDGGKCVGPSKQMKPCLEKRCPGLCMYLIQSLSPSGSTTVSQTKWAVKYWRRHNERWHHKNHRRKTSLIISSSLLLNGQFFVDEISNRRETALLQHHEQNQAVKLSQTVTPTFLVIHVTF